MEDPTGARGPAAADRDVGSRLVASRGDGRESSQREVECHLEPPDVYRRLIRLMPGGSRTQLCAWIAVMATVVTMSCTVAPRERSLTGFARPWRTGPIATAPAERCTALSVLLPVEVGDDEHGRPPAHLTAGQFQARDLGVDGGVILDRSLHQHPPVQDPPQHRMARRVPQLGCGGRTSPQRRQHERPSPVPRISRVSRIAALASAITTPWPRSGTQGRSARAEVGPAGMEVARSSTQEGGERDRAAGQCGCAADARNRDPQA